MNFTLLEAYKAFIANLFSKITKLFISFFLISFLARNLPINIYASYDASLIIYTFILVIGNVGFNEYIVNNLVNDKNKLSSIFLVNFFIGSFFAFLLFLLSYFNFWESDLININLRILSIVVVLFILKSFFSSICIIEKKLSFVSYFSGLSAIIAISITLYLYYLGYVNYLMSINILIIESLEFLFYFVVVKKTFLFSYKINFPKEIISFSKNQYLFNLLNYFSRNIDNIFIVTFLGVVSFSFYARSYQLLMLIVMLISDVVYNVYHRYLLNFISKKNDLFVFFENTLIVVSYLVFALSILLSLNSSFIIEIIFGNKWNLSSSYFQILSFSISSQVLLTFFGPLFQIFSNGRLLLASILCSISLILISLYIGIYLNHNINLFCILYLISNFILLLITCLFYFKSIKKKLPKIYSYGNIIKLFFDILIFLILLLLFKKYLYKNNDIYFFIYSLLFYFVFLFIHKNKFISFFKSLNSFNHNLQ